MSIGTSAPGVSRFDRWREVITGEVARATPVARGVYVHVPYCSTRCGYCDFNTYTAAELPGARREDYATHAITEIAWAGDLWHPGVLDTVFIGGGTPTLVGPADLGRILSAIDSAVGLSAGAEITVEANPDSVSIADLRELRAAGVTRMSFGVQSLAPHVLRVLERTHTPGRALAAVREAREVGFEHVSVDLIYATPGETAEDWAGSVSAVLQSGIDHLSAYSLIVEPGTRLAARVRRGEVPMPDDDVAAQRYSVVDAAARAAGLEWYEVSNWARPGAQCRHNLGYWRDGDWWGIGPGAHSHIGDLRWWNVKHPQAYARHLAAGHLPVDDGEILSTQERSLERVMLGLRLREGLAVADLPEGQRAEVDALVADHLVTVESADGGDRVVLTDRGRLLADAVVRRLTP